MLQERFRRPSFDRIAFVCSTFPFVSLLILGSYNTVLLYVVAAYGLYVMARGRLRTDLLRDAPEFRFACIVFAGYYLMGAINTLAHYQVPGDLYYLAHDLGFLFFPVVALLVLPSCQMNVIPRAVALALLGNVLGFFYAEYQKIYELIVRPDGGMGNPLFFAGTAALFTFLAFTGFHRRRPRDMAICLLGITAGIGCVFISESRGPILTLPPLVLCYFYYLKQEGVNPRRLLLVLAVLAVAFLAPLIKYHTVLESRIDLTRQELALPEEKMVGLSAGTRVLYWKYGWQVFTEHPWFGVGTASVMPMTYAAMPPAIHDAFQKHGLHKQLHSEYLNALVGRGILGLALTLLVYAAPIAIALMSPRNKTYHDRLYIGLITSVAYACLGIANPTFGRDISNAIFLFSTLLILIDSANARQSQRSAA